MQRLHEGRTPRPLNAITPQAPTVVAVQTPKPGASTQNQPKGDTLIERIFRDVVRDLGGEEPSRTPDWNPQTGNDR